MKGRRMLILFSLLLLVGCGRADLENSTLTLMMGLDLDPEGMLILYMESPVFAKEAKDKTETIRTTADTIRETRANLDAVATGLVTGRKVQTLLIGPRLAHEKDWMQLLDLMYRDPKLPTNMTVVLTEGQVGDIFMQRLADKPRLSLHIRQLVDTARLRNITVKTSMQELHRQITERGITPSVSSLRKGKNTTITGTALLDRNGKPVDTLNLQDSKLLLMLQNQVKGELSLTIEEDSHKGISFTVGKVQQKLKSGFEQGRFTFDVHLHLHVVVTESTHGFRVSENMDRVEKMITESLTDDFNDLIDRFQKKQVDPVGFGIYARAKCYQEWKGVENQWPEAFAKAKVRVIPEVEIQHYGAVQ